MTRLIYLQDISSVPCSISAASEDLRHWSNQAPRVGRVRFCSLPHSPDYSGSSQSCRGWVPNYHTTLICFCLCCISFRQICLIDMFSYRSMFAYQVNALQIPLYACMIKMAIPIYYRDIYSPKALVIPRNMWLRLNMTEQLFTGTINHNQNKNKQKPIYYNIKLIIFSNTW